MAQDLVIDRDERSYDAERKAAGRADKRDLTIPDVANPERRRRCEADDCLWLNTYLPDVFYNPFSEHQKKIIADCGEALKYGTKKCKAAPRGDGKSSIVKYLALKYALTRQVTFPLVVAATSSKAKKTLASLKRRLAGSVTFSARDKTFRTQSPLGEDYPLECCTACYVDPWPSRARNVTANGQRPIHVEWGADWFIVPTWEDEEPIGPILLALGVTSDELQGCNVYDRRPDFVMIDDLDSRDSLASEDGVVAEKIEEAIDKTIAGLGGQSRGLGQFMLCTITSKESAAYKYSDPAQKPAFSGERIAAIQKWPERKDLWDEYVRLRQKGKGTLNDAGAPLDVFGREAHAFYLAHREAMDDGAVLANPYNFEAVALPDGSQKQVSSLQRCYDYIADEGMDSFLTEHQNDPQDEETDGTRITQRIVAKRITGLEHRELPHADCVLVAFMDVGDHVCYFAESAWLPECIGSITDYGTFDVPKATTLDVSLKRVFHEWRNDLLSKYTINGTPKHPSVVLIDSGDGQHTEAVYSFCREVGPPFFPSKGMKDHWRPPQKTRNRGDWWECVKQEDRFRTGLYEFNATYHKQFTHARFMTPTFDENNQRMAGSLGIYVCAEQAEVIKKRREFTHQIVGEVWGTKKLGAKPGWITTGKNHFLDVTAGNCLAANIAGIRLGGEAKKPQAQRKSLQELAKGA